MPPKGKQATKGGKQIQEENEETLKFYFYIIIGVSVVYYLSTFSLFYETTSITSMVLAILATSILVASYQFMKYMAKPTIDNTSGALLSPGTDLNMTDGLAEHVKDLLLLTAIVQTLSLVSSYFWLLLLFAPGRAFYLLWVNFLGPWFFAPPPEVDEKKQKKMERKMKRR